MEDIERYEPLLIGDVAPVWTAITTSGKLNLSDFLGKWVVMFSHPADFTPVCTSEFIAFAERFEEFKRRGIQLIGLSVDSVHSHIAWMRNIEEKFGVKVPFPIIADVEMTIAKLYGMIHRTTSSTNTVRSVFLIDDKGILRTILHYPISNGRNIDEIIRLIDALQTSDKYGVATPANWTKGEKVIVPPPVTLDDAEHRMTQDYDCTDWYFCKKEI